MKYAIVNGEKAKATKGVTGFCPNCGSELIANCGEVKVHHWAHKEVRNCDPWWENETKWHRSWKEQFPKVWQEVIHTAEDGEKHIADVKTETGWVIEFQHSYLKPEERRSRDTFYSKLVWVVDGLRRKRDKKLFENILKEGRLIHSKPNILKVSWPDECRLLAEWQRSSNLVFFDFQESILWFLLPTPPNSEAYLMHIQREDFIDLHKDERFGKLISKVIEPVKDQIINQINKQQRNRDLINRYKGISNRELRRRNRRF